MKSQLLPCVMVNVMSVGSVKWMTLPSESRVVGIS